MTSVLSLDLSAVAPGRYRVDVLQSPAGEASASFDLDVEEVIRRLPELQTTILASAVSSRRFIGRDEASVRRVGQLLFDALFSSVEVGSVYRISNALATERGESLRLVLRIGAPELATLPWECLFDRSADSFISRREPLVRYVPVPATPPPLKVAAPLRVMALIASPRGLVALDGPSERRSLTRALSPLVNAGVLTIEWIEGATWSSLQDALLGEAWHVVHFIGHGDFDVARDEGVLFLEDEQGWPHRVSADSFVDLLREVQPMPRLVVLNTCGSSTSGRTDLFSGSAATLVRGGVSAVAAMQFEISDRAAIAFCHGFYTAIGRGRGVDEAVRSGRVAILGLAEGSLEWITPTLYLRGEQTKLFSLSQSPSETKDTVLDAYRTQAENAAGRGDVATAIPFYDSVLAEDPDDRAAMKGRELSLAEGRTGGGTGLENAPLVESQHRFDEIWKIASRAPEPDRAQKMDIAVLRRRLQPSEEIIGCARLAFDGFDTASVVLTDQYLHLVTSRPGQAGWIDLAQRTPGRYEFASGHLRIARDEIVGVGPAAECPQLDLKYHGLLRLTSRQDARFLTGLLAQASSSSQSASPHVAEGAKPLGTASATSPQDVALPASARAAGRGSRRRFVAVFAIALLSVASAATVVALRPLVAPSGSDGSTLGGPSSAAPSLALPASSALRETELVISRQVDGSRWSLYLANTLSPRPGPRLTSTEGSSSSAALSPDRRTVIYRHQDDNGKISLRVAGSADLTGDRLLFQLPKGCDTVLRPAWNRSDVTLLAIGCRDARHTTLRLMRTDGTVVSTVNPPVGRPRTGHLAFSADGKRLGFWATSDENANDGRLYTVPVAGGTPQPVFPTQDSAAEHDAELAFSPDGDHIAFTRREGSHYDIVVARTDGKDVRLLTGDSANDLSPAWSPDGKWIAFTSDAPASARPATRLPRIWIHSSTKPASRLLWPEDAPESQALPAWS